MKQGMPVYSEHGDATPACHLAPSILPHPQPPPPCCHPHCQAVRKLMDTKKLEGTLSYDSSFGDSGQKG